jgi:hypothetical protein
MLYNRCADVDDKFWEELAAADPKDIRGRTGITRQGHLFRFPCCHLEAVADLDRRRVYLAAEPDAEPGFRLCLLTLLYLLQVDIRELGPPISPLELTGATTFFQARGPHAIPRAPLEERFGQDLAGFMAAGQRLGAEPRDLGDGAFALMVFPGLPVEVILWEVDEEFPAQVSYTVPQNLDRFWQLDAVLALMGLVLKMLLKAAVPPAA